MILFLPVYLISFYDNYRRWRCLVPWHGIRKEWYVIHTYSGYENKVKANLERKIHSMGMEDKIFNVIVPVEKETEKRNGKEKVVERKIFPGYVLLE